jgi:hypothetical protein
MDQAGYLFGSPRRPSSGMRHIRGGLFHGDFDGGGFVFLVFLDRLARPAPVILAKAGTQ